MTRRARSLGVGLLAALVIVVMPGVASAAPKNVTPAKWAKAVCTGVGSWLDQLTGHSPVVPTKDAAATKAVFASYLTDSIAATDTLVKTLKAAGTPGIRNGTAIAKLVVSTFSNAGTGLDQVATTAAGLPTTDVTTFNAAAASFQTQVQSVITTAGQQLTTATMKYRSAKLDRAFAAEPACQLGSTGSTTTTAPAATAGQPTCDAASLLAAAKTTSPSAASVDAFACGNGWAGAGVTLNPGNSGGVATATIFKAQGTTWVEVGRTSQNCNDPTMPATVHYYCTVS